MGVTTVLLRAAGRAGETSPVRPEDLAAAIRDGLAPLLIDLREPEACATGRVPGSENIPERRTSALVMRISRSAEVVLVCDDGRMSSMAARTLRFCGHRVTHLDGGVKAWIAQGRPMMRVTSSGALREVRPCEESRDGRPGPLTLILQALNLRVISVALLGAAWTIAAALALVT